MFFTIIPILFFMNLTNLINISNSFLVKPYFHVITSNKINNNKINKINTNKILIHPLRNKFKNDEPDKKIERKIIFEKLYLFIKSKTNSYLKLIRYKNIAPTFLLSLTGGWLMNPSLFELIQNPSFIGASLNTILIMSSSMVVNDIYDVEIDKINNPKRPLVTGEISIIEAYLFTFFLLQITQYINILYIPEPLQFITDLSTIFVFIYTPILKRIIFLKNVSCAALVAFSVFFAGVASTNQVMNLNQNFGIFSLVISFIFLGSLYNEIMLDIYDYEGDKQNKIITIPVIFGKNNAWKITNFLLWLNIFMNSLALMSVYNFYAGLIFYFISIPLITRSIEVKKQNFAKDYVKRVVNKTNMQLFIILLYFCSLTFL